MSSKAEKLTPSLLTFRIRGFTFSINTGELLFPAIALGFCIAYYFETLGLPDESLLYARPLLYATAFLAVTTMSSHAISINTTTDGRDGSSEDSSQSVVWGVEKSVVDEEHPQADSANTENHTSREEVAGSNEFFNFHSAGGLVLLSAAYVLSLYLVPFVVATALFLVATVYLFGERSMLRVVGYSVGFSLLLWLVFVNWLLVPLP